jgi:hypothetical protein
MNTETPNFPATKRIRVKKDLDSIRALFKANVPSKVIELIIGREFLASDHLEVSVVWLGRETTWCLPPSAVELVS